MTHKKLAVLIASLCALPVMASGLSDASAGVRIRVGGRVVVRTPHVVYVRTMRPRVRLHIGGGIYFGGSYGGFAEPPPPPPPDCYYDCAPPPPPVYPTYTAYAPPPPVVIGAPAEPFGPRLGLGIFAGTTKLEGSETGDVGLTGRLRLTRGLSLEGELAKARADNVESRRAGLGLSWDLAPRSQLSPQLIGMMGRWDDQNYAEVGAGLTYRLSDRLSISADLRAGALEQAQAARDGTIAKSTGGSGTAADEPLQYTRGRIGAMLMF
ncbi:MAG TPA: hypothetical protein VL172_03195 [Kofleriaceae bacterium]|nr:hypothetical protein [Kofleriaceae bacterium]